MTADATFVVYENGIFAAVPVPEDLSAALDEAWRGARWQDAVSAAIGAECALITLGAVGVTGYEIAAWHTADRGSLVGISNDVGLVSIVQVPDPRDWWPFQTQHLVPLVSSIANLASREPLGRLADAFISYARHGEGRHINRGDGSSTIEQDELEAWRARMAGRRR